MSREFKIFCAVFAVTLLGLWVWYPYSPMGAQERNMRLAAEHIPAIRSLLDKDKRFGQVDLGPFTAQGGSLVVGGVVSSDTDFNDLRQLIRSTSPPVPVVYRIKIHDREVTLVD